MSVLNTSISQGSVATYLRNGGIFFDDHFIATLLLNVSVKDFDENRSIFNEVMKTDGLLIQ